MSRTCGGCEGRGRHWRWCPEVVGAQAHRWGVMADTIEDFADQIGSNDTAAANHLYAAAGLIRSEARTAADNFAVAS